MDKITRKRAQNRLETWANHYVLESWNVDVSLPVADLAMISGQNYRSRVPRGVFFHNQDPLTRLLKARLSDRDFDLAVYLGMGYDPNDLSQKFTMTSEAIRKAKQRIMKLVSNTLS